MEFADLLFDALSLFEQSVANICEYIVVKGEIAWLSSFSYLVSINFNPFPKLHHFETVPNSKKLQTTTETWLLKDFKIQIAWKTLWRKG